MDLSVYTHNFTLHEPRSELIYDHPELPWPLCGFFQKGFPSNVLEWFQYDPIYDDDSLVQDTYDPYLLITFIFLPIPLRFLWNYLWIKLEIWNLINTKKAVTAKDQRRTRDSIFMVIHLMLSFTFCTLITWNETFRDPFAVPGKPYYYAWYDRMYNYEILWCVKIVYNLVTAFYIHGLISITVFEEKKSDFLLLFTHHVVTLILIYCSVLGRQQRIGVVIMLLMDINDIQLELSKIFNRLGRDYLAAISFIIFVYQWFYNRMYLFGLYVLKSYSYYQYWMGCFPRKEGPCDRLWQANQLLSWVIFFMSVYWSYLILIKLFGLLKTLFTSGIENTFKSGQDPRERDSGDSHRKSE